MKKGYIHLLSGNFGMVAGHKAGILRIKKGDTDFDPTVPLDDNRCNYRRRKRKQQVGLLPFVMWPMVKPTDMLIFQVITDPEKRDIPLYRAEP